MVWNRLSTSGLFVALALVLAVGCSPPDGDHDTGVHEDGTNGTDGGPTTPTCDDPQELTENSIDSDDTLSGCYEAPSGLKVQSGATLTVEPGTVIQFGENTSLTVEGRMTATGTASEPIAFTGTTEMPGWWNGVDYYNSDSSVNELDHVIIEYAGPEDNVGNLTLSSCCGNKSTLSVSNTTLRHSATYGFSMDGSAVFSEFSSNTLTKNAAGAGRLNAQQIDDLDSASSYSGNDTDILAVAGGTVQEEVTWPTVGVPLRVMDNVKIQGFVTISEGNTFEFTENKALTVENKMAVAGAEDAKVTFTGTTEQKGWWGGIEYYNSDSTQNSVAHAIIEYGGDSGDAALRANTCCGNTTTLSLENSTLRHSAGVGFMGNNSTVLEAFANNTLTKNQEGAVDVDASLVDSFESSNSFAGNDADYLKVAGEIEDTGSWHGFDTPIRADGLKVNSGAELTINEGATLMFTENTEFLVEGTMKSLGSSGAKVTMKGVQSTKGFWKSLHFYNTDSQNNSVQHTVIADAGGNGKGNLTLDTCCGSTTTLTADNVTVKNGENAGIYLDGSSSLRSCNGLNSQDCASPANIAGTDKSLSELQSEKCN